MWLDKNLSVFATVVTHSGTAPQMPGPCGTCGHPDTPAVARCTGRAHQPSTNADTALTPPGAEVMPVTAQTADSHALVHSGLRRKGQPMPTDDLWTAASALEHGAALLTRDAHFAQIDGRRCGQRLEDVLP